MRPSRHLCTILGAAALALAGCGNDPEEDAPNDAATLLLNTAPDAVHAGIYTTLQRDYDGALGLRLTVQAPAAGADAVALVNRERVQFAILDINVFARARERGRDLIGVMALVQKPLPGTDPRGRRPADRQFHVNDADGPPYPELVLATSRQVLRDKPALVRATVQSLTRGYQEILIDPETGARDMTAEVKGLDRNDLTTRLDALSTSFTAPDAKVGQLPQRRIRSWADFAFKRGYIKRKPNYPRAFDGRFATGEGRGF